MRIKRHEQSYIVVLSDNSSWHIWPSDLAKTLEWRPTTNLDVIKVEHEICTHALVDSANGSRVKVSVAGVQWPIDIVRSVLALGG